MAEELKNTRFLVIESSIWLEELISKTIGFFLDINWKTSKSLGFGPSSLSLDQKTQIIQDLKGVDAMIINKFSCMMNIRNQFTHVREVNSFENFFKTHTEGEEIKKSLSKWYATDETEKLSEEEQTRKYYLLLFNELMDFLVEISKTHAFDKDVKTGEKNAS